MEFQVPKYTLLRGKVKKNIFLIILAMESIDSHYLPNRFVDFWRYPGFPQDSILNSPAPSTH
jgi:hypothetical protein